MSKALIGYDVTYDEFILMINEEKKQFRLKENGAKGDQLGGIEMDRLVNKIQ